MKKMLAMLLLLALLLTACASPQEPTNTQPPTEAPTAAPALESTEGPTEEPTEAPTEAPAGKLEAFSQAGTIEETVLYEENGVKITAKSLTYDDYEATLTLEFENNSGVEVNFLAGAAGCSCTSINGLMTPDGYLNCDVPAGKKALDTMTFDYYSLMLYGIFEIADMEVGIRIQDDDYNEIARGAYPISTTLADSHDYAAPWYRQTIQNPATQGKYNYTLPWFSEETVYDADGLTVVSQAVVENRDGEKTLLLETVNRTESPVNVSTANIAFNGLTVSPSTWSVDTVNPGKTAIVTVRLDSVMDADFRALAGVGPIGSVGLDMRFRDMDADDVAEPARIQVDIPGVEPVFDNSGRELYAGNGVHLVCKGIFPSPYSYSDDLRMLLLAENTSGQNVEVGSVYDSLSINGYMTGIYVYSVTAADGTWTLLDVRLSERELEPLQITQPDQIETLSFTLRLRDANHRTIEETEVTWTAQ